MDGEKAAGSSNGSATNFSEPAYSDLTSLGLDFTEA